MGMAVDFMRNWKLSVKKKGTGGCGYRHFCLKHWKRMRGSHFSLFPFPGRSTANFLYRFPVASNLRLCYFQRGDDPVAPGIKLRIGLLALGM